MNTKENSEQKVSILESNDIDVPLEENLPKEITEAREKDTTGVEEGITEVIVAETSKPIEEKEKSDVSIAVYEEAIAKISASLQESLDAKIAALQADISKMFLKINNRILMDDIRDKTIADMREELCGLRQDFLFRAMKPLINGIIDILDDALDMIQKSTAIDSDLKILSYFQTTVQDVLALVEIQPFKSEDKVYDPAHHSIIGSQSTSDTALDRRIMRSTLSGLLHGEAVLRKEKVIIYKYDSSVADETKEENKKPDKEISQGEEE